MKKINFKKMSLVLFLLAQVFCSNAQMNISGGAMISGGICKDGAVYVWGYNYKKQLGITSPTDTVSIPTQVAFPEDDPFFFGVQGSTTVPVKVLDAGSGNNFLALDNANGVWAWGNNYNGQCGNGQFANTSSTTYEPITIPTRVLKGLSPGGTGGLAPYLTGVRSITGGDASAYCLMETGEVMAWGNNNMGQLGNGTQIKSATPVYVINGSTMSNLQHAVQVQTAEVTAYALVDPDGDGVGTVYSWGSNNINGGSGMLGRSAAGGSNNKEEGLSSGTVSMYALPVCGADGAPLNSIVAIAASDVFCLALDVDGRVWVWGNNGWSGCCGVGYYSGSFSDPRYVVAGEWASTTMGAGETYLRAKTISGGQGFGTAVTIDGIPVAWGNNQSCYTFGAGGRLGNGTLISSFSPVIIKTAANTYNTDVVSISAADTWGFYQTSNDDVYTWGTNDFGQLGLGNKVCNLFAVPFVNSCSGSVTTATTKASVTNPFKVYPNPTTGTVFITFDQKEAGSIELMDARGILLKKVYVSGKDASISMDGLSNGIYFINLITESGTYVSKVVKD